MKKIRQFILLTLLTSCFGNVFSQSTDSLNIYPNPFIDSTVIHFYLSQNDSVSLTIFDITGRGIRSCFRDTLLTTGSYTVNFNSDTLHAGVYFVSLQTGFAKSMSKKVIKIGASSSIEENEIYEPDLLLYPNPTADLLFIPGEGDKTILVKDMNGKVVKNCMTVLNAVSFKDLPCGAYFVTIYTDKKQIIATQKIILEN